MNHESRAVRAGATVLANRNRVGAYIVVGVVSIVLIALGFFAVGPGRGADVLLGLGTAGVFAVVFSYLVGWAEAERTDQAFDERLLPVENELRTLSSLTERFAAQHLAVRIYRAKNEPDPMFNRAMNEMLETSQTFRFRGGSGQFVLPRLHVAGRSLREVELLMPDPRYRGALILRASRQRAEQRRSNGQYVDTLEAYIDGLRLRILETICGLATLDHLDVRIGLLPFDASDTRLEMLDDACFVGVRDHKTAQMTIPTTFQYRAGRFWYEHYAREFNAQMEYLHEQGSVLHFTRETLADSDVATRLTDFLGDRGTLASAELSADQVREWREKAVSSLPELTGKIT